MSSVDNLISTYSTPGVRKLHITGVMMQYFEICKRELWFESESITIDKSNKNIVIGEEVDEKSYSSISRERVFIGGMISPDILDDGTVVEIKPSSSITDGSKAQLEYYLWVFAEVLDNVKDGVLAVPSENKRINIQYTDKIKNRVESRISEIENIINSNEPPKLEKKSICETCAFQDICWVNEGVKHE
jgi:CRISPR-associated exonuclease Cas4